MTKPKQPSLAFVHAMRGVIHAMMAATALDVHAGFYRPRSRKLPFVVSSVTMLDWWYLHDKHFDCLGYVWLPTDGVVPDEAPEIGHDCYQPPNPRKRRKGGVKGRLARLLREFDGTVVH